MTQKELYEAEERAIFGIEQPEQYDMIVLMDDDSGDE